MSISEQLIHHLNQRSGYTNLVPVGQTVYLQALDGTPYPRVVLEDLVGDSARHQTAGSGQEDELWQMTAWAEDADVAIAIRHQLFLALHGLRGTIGPGGSQVRISSCFRVGKRAFPSPITDASEVPKVACQSDFRIWHEETVPTF